MYGYGACLDTGDLQYVLCKGSEVLNTLMPFLVALGVVFLVWGVVQYFIGDNEEAKKKGRDRIVFGIIGLAVILSIWGLVYILMNTFGLGWDTAPYPDELQRLLPRQPGAGSPPDGETIMNTPGLFPG